MVVRVNTAVIRVGRLLEVRILHYRTVADVAQLFKLIGSELRKLGGATQVVVVADWRYCPVMSEDAAKYALAAMTQNNPLVLRSGALASRGSPSAVLQFLRLVRESKNESRRLFFDEHELTGWLGEVLTQAESERLTEFLNEPVEVPPRRKVLGG
jgi:hypothetical protein